MKCPKCKKTIEKVGVTSQCWQWATLNEDKIDNYDSVEEVEDVLGIWCPKCLKDITNYIKEE